MKLFELQTHLTSYTYPIVKIIICVTIIILSITRDHFIHISSEWQTPSTILFCAIILVSLLCLEISIGEVFQTFSNRKKVNVQAIETKDFSVDEIMDMVSANDIIEIEICNDSNILKIGASSDSKYSSSVFFDKQYYINDLNYDTIELFQTELIALFPKGKIPVFSIDGISTKDESLTGYGAQ